MVNLTEELEKLVDETSVLDVLIGLEIVCSEKAMLLKAGHRVVTREGETAKLWARRGAACMTAARAFQEKGI